MILEYVWIDGNFKLRSKYMTLNIDHISLEKIPLWNYDGSSTNQGDTENSEVILSPKSYYKNPFFPTVESYLVMCDTYNRNEVGDLIPTFTNNRYFSNIIFNKSLQEIPWFGIEQEYFMMGKNNYPIINSSPSSLLKEQGDYYCGVGANNISFRKLAEKHYTYCLYSELSISGINAEVAPSQWEYQIGPVEGIWAGDQLWISRYILQKLGEEFDVVISFTPKPLVSPWNGSGLHTNFSTLKTRIAGGLDLLLKYIEKLSKKHLEIMEKGYYGDNSQRLTGLCETSSLTSFTYGIGTRNTSVRIPKQVYINHCGYLEDRRPASDADPYLVTGIIFDVCCSEEK